MYFHIKTFWNFVFYFIGKNGLRYSRSETSDCKWVLLKGFQCVSSLRRLSVNNMLVPQKIKPRIILWLNNSTPMCIPKRTETMYSNKYMYTHVHSTMIHNCQKVGTTEMSINWWTDKENAVYPYHGMSFNIKRMKYWHML